MRKYDNKNKISIGVIIAISVVVIIVFSYFIFKVISTSKIEYSVNSSSILYDVSKNMIEVKDSGIIKKKWSSKYYLLSNDKNYMLGNYSVVYTPNSGNISLYGKFYDIKNDTTVDILEDETKLESSLVSHFYKIQDRKYLIVSSSIYTESRELDTNNYLIVELDRRGNALLYNNDVNVKTFSLTTIITPDFTFDIANEVLNYGDVHIDLKKIIGSSNEYSSEDIEISDNDYSDMLENSNNNNNNNNNNNSDNSGINGGNGGNGSLGNDIIDEVIKVSKNTSIIRVVPFIDSINLDYVIYDPMEEYKNVYIEVVNTSIGTSNIINLNKSSKSIRINDLSPNTKYKIYLYTVTSIGSSNESMIEISTKAPNVSLSLSSISMDNISYIVKFDNTYDISEMNIDLLLGDKVIDSFVKTNIGNTSIVSDDIDISKYDLENGIVMIRVTNIWFNGNKFSPNIYYKFSF